MSSSPIRTKLSENISRFGEERKPSAKKKFAFTDKDLIMSHDYQDPATDLIFSQRRYETLDV